MPDFRPALLLGLLAASQAYAQAPPPAETYPDPDPAAQYASGPDPRDRRSTESLTRQLRIEPNNIALRVQMARLLLDRGQPGRAAAEFQRAIAAADSGETLSRYARWNYAWALFESADPAGALAQWQLAAEAHGGRPDWLPLVTALVLWMQGDRERAIAFYAAAVATDAGRWASAEALQRSIGEWPANARFTLESVRQAWSERR
jgi:tetratricopeptide (TPR) repeat protein